MRKLFLNKMLQKL